ncbi:MAG: hypothetical protein AAFV62_05010 [Pseudomonadota bacterium]
MKEDVFRLIRQQPLMAAASAGSATRRLEREIRALDAWGAFLPHWRYLRCEPLDFAYGYLAILGCYSEELRDDLFFRVGGVQPPAIAAWISALLGRASDAQALRRLVDARPARPWIYEFALNSIEESREPMMAEPLNLMARLREVIHPIHKPMIQLRRERPVPPEAFEELRSNVSAIYRRDGLDAALAFIETQTLDDGRRVTELIRVPRLSERRVEPSGAWLWAFS